MDPGDLLNPKLLVPIAGSVVVLVGVVVAVARMKAASNGRAALERWSRGAYSIWTGGEDCATWGPDRAQNALRDWYGATGGPRFWEVIRDLRAGQTGNVAWDCVRALDLLRIGMAARYIDADSCLKESAAIGQELQRRFRSWEELAQAFEAGMHAWQRSRKVTDPEQLGRVQRNLPALRQQIWPSIAFGAPLRFDDD